MTAGKRLPSFADFGQFVNILDPARSFENQGFEPRRNRGAQFQAQRFGARDHFLRIVKVGRCNLVHDFHVV